MDPKPLENYKKPEYPAIGDIKDKKGFLSRFIPEKWQTKALVTGAAILLLTGGLELHKQQNPCFLTQITGTCFIDDTREFLSDLWSKSVSPSSGKTNYYSGTAGIFMEPNKITEADIKDVIEIEFRKSIIVFEQKNYNVGDKVNPLFLDGYSTTDKIGFKTICKDDLRQIADWGGVKVSSFNTNKDAADFLQKELMKRKKIRCAGILIPENSKSPGFYISNPQEQVSEFVKTIKTPGSEDKENK
jgi:hypothetical protein